MGATFIPYSFWFAAVQSEIPSSLGGSVTALAFDSDLVVQGVLLLLVVSSVVSWTIIFAKAYQF